MPIGWTGRCRRSSAVPCKPLSARTSWFVGGRGSVLLRGVDGDFKAAIYVMIAAIVTVLGPVGGVGGGEMLVCQYTLDNYKTTARVRL